MPDYAEIIISVDKGNHYKCNGEMVAKIVADRDNH